ncbi:MAG: M67 family metallopeptidase [Nitrospinae bacterium]|nr:M67 family metallopeptidase [Nitrospinota bacterium]
MRLNREQVEAMHRHARGAYPDECCGLIIGPPRTEGEREETLALLPCKNVQNEMHEKDPEFYPRTARRAFLIDPFEFERIVRRAEEAGEVVRGIFHSHPDEDAYFSQEDVDAAVPFGDIPAFPDAEHVVMSVREGEVLGQKVYSWDAEQKTFIENDLVILEEAGA